MEFTDIDKNLTNGQNMGGIAQICYYCAWEDVATFPTVPATPATIEENGVLTGSIAMKAGKQMRSIYITDDTGEFEIEPVGETDGKSFVTHLRFYNPGLKAKILGFMNWAKNENLVFIVKDNDGQYYLMGDDTRPATYAGAPDGSGTSKETAGRRGISMEFVYKTANLYAYEGDIPLTPAASV
ncbi:hypothetical protein OU798_07480 [Prolixibacteraceae bacterium Z1-6]|uniref:Uncharacterized protein n=1 Tax=Draconibacterium aestuarii TaxID=2998507 RepID=A0A9X3J590_9BACT|nr:hypothetical protein [Prolixibacteraceae bacterium Z1-6]